MSASPAPSPTAASARLGLSARILIGLAVGVLAGLFFGEPAAALQPIADIYIRLMQMTVLPYLVLTLIIGLGRMEAAEAKRLAVRASVLLLVFWAAALAVVGATTLAFPDMETASFFSSSLVSAREPLALHELYVPSNPFNAMANAVIPAVVLFSSALGVALIGIEKKATLLGNLQVLEQAVSRVTRFVISLTPIGVFAIAAVSAGTMSPETLERLEVYFAAFAVASLLLAFVVLPLAVAAVTPFTYLEIVRASRDALLTAFVASNVFIVLPMLVEQANALMEKRGVRSPQASSTVEALVPMAFTFPNAGKLLTLLFVPYVAWLSGVPLEADRFGTLFGAGLLAYFAKAQVALPFLLDLMDLPHDHFQLYIPTTIVTGKFDSMVSAMSLLAFSLIGAAAMTGFLRISAARLLLTLALIAAAGAASVLGTRAVLSATVDTSYHKGEVLRKMHASRSEAPNLVHRDLSNLKQDPELEGLSPIQRIRARGTLRVGYDPGNLPFSFFNADGDLVGLDVELAQAFAESIGVVAEFVPVAWQELPRMLASDTIDLMPGVWYRPFWFSSVRLSEPYFEGTMGFVVRDARRHEFASTDTLRRRRGLRIGVPLDPDQVRASLERYFGSARVDFVPLESAAPFLEGRHPELDAFLMPAEAGAAATLLHPEYAIVVPQPNPVRVPTAFGAAPDARDLIETVNEWIVFAQSSGRIREAYDYWVLGQGAEPKGRRWSILHDLLGWGHEASDRPR
ncbi:cation:dicarboxylase symporter family transporter [Burkholderiaceae bacterium FT117]|uniref:cation:dicarboxylate symporter family transporter n=1 Tax=Zeimonas sediminis TaxID=2944268 RepID=UPI00234301BB|nr:cation:dicarboxylase symporter family transporter [Zeimonas sediminis]MCM5570083.1 cation:dicarboxylase symporter family transporter [Zeimonas sediminis]